MIIETERLILRPFHETDAADVYEYLHEPAVNCFESMKLDTLEDAKAEMKKRIGETEYYFAITLKEGGKVIGEIEAYPEAGEPHEDENVPKDTFSPCWMLNLNYTGKGYAYEAAVFGKEDFGEYAANTLKNIKTICADEDKTYYIGGYSLAGLFALWTVHQTDLFSGVAAASPSLWFPGFTDYMKRHEFKTDTAYLSLGDKEEKTRNPIMATVDDRIREAHVLLIKRGVNCILEWNDGNHFKDSHLRTAKAFSWLINNKR